jgi:F-type H+-transporting ATPase subunit delta
VRGDVESLLETLKQYPAFGRLLAAPKIDVVEREKILRKTFEGRIGQLTLNFLLVLNQRWRLGGMQGILSEYIEMDNARRLGRRDVRVTSAVALDEGALARIRQGIAAWGGFEPVLEIKEDPSLLGGLVVQIGDRKIDASVQGQLERLREQLKKEFQAKVTAPA